MIIKCNLKKTSPSKRWAKHFSIISMHAISGYLSINLSMIATKYFPVASGCVGVHSPRPLVPIVRLVPMDCHSTNGILCWCTSHKLRILNFFFRMPWLQAVYKWYDWHQCIGTYHWYSIGDVHLLLGFPMATCTWTATWSPAEYVTNHNNFLKYNTSVNYCSSLRSWRDFARECFCFGRAVNASRLRV